MTQSFKWFTPPINADIRFSEPRPFDRSDRVDILTGTPEPDAFELYAPGIGTQSLDDNFIALGIPINVNSSEDSEVDLLVYQKKEGPDYIPRFTAPPARSYTYIEDFDPIEDEIIVGGKPYRIEIDDEIIAGESSNDFDDDFDLFVLEKPWRDQNLDVADLIVTDFQISDNDRIIMAGKDLG